MRLTRRTEPRYEPPDSVVVEVHIMGAESLNILRARDISPSGLGVRVPHGFAPADLDSELELVVALPGDRSFLARGVVRHRGDAPTPSFFGIEFTDLKPENRQQILDFIRRLTSSKEPAGNN